MFENFSKKAQYVESAKFSQVIRTMTESMYVVNNIHKTSPIPKRLIKQVQLDITYIFLKYRHWVYSPVLIELTLDFLVCEYAMPQDLAKSLVLAATEALMEFVPPAKQLTTANYDEGFLQTAISFALVSNEKQSFEVRTGFGDTLSQIVASSCNFEKQQPGFQKEASEVLRFILEGFQKDIDEKPWLLDLYKLRQIVEESSFYSPLVYNYDVMESYFQTLVDVEVSQIDSASQASQKELKALKALGLIFQKHQQKPTMFALSDLGQSLAANYILTQVQEKSLSFDKAQSLGDIVVERILLNSDLETLLTFVEKSTKWKSRPRVVAGLMRRLDELDREKSLDLLSNLKHNELNSWTKIAICEVLKTLQWSKQSEEFLSKAVKDSQSVKVRRAAREGVSFFASRHTEETR
ncbi:MAG: hypothetical protein HRU19_19230 [Pseudobacteriovorax sp.]|nr:hypothetical protein [Pseudobacteriovorax sp.]